MLRGKSGSGLGPATAVRTKHSQWSPRSRVTARTGPCFLLSSQQLLPAKELTLDSAV